MPERKLIAFDADDLTVMSTLLQDALVQVGDMRVERDAETGQRLFTAVLNRFDWEESSSGPARPIVGADGTFSRRLTGLRVAQVEGAQLRGIDRRRADVLLNLLALRFEPGTAPSGAIVLEFAAGASVRLQVECIEASLADLGPQWTSRNQPSHAQTQDAGREDDPSPSARDETEDARME